MDYLKILKRAYQITIKHKFLWLFGFLVALTSGGINFNLNFSSQGMGDQFPKIAEGIGDFVIINWILILIILVFLFLLFLAFWILSIFSQSALIGCVNKIDRGESTGMKDGFIIGKTYFWRMLGLSLLIGIIIFLSVLILGGPVVLLFVYKLWLRAVVLLLLALLILIPEIVLFSLILKYAQRYIVIARKGIFESIKLSFVMIKKNLGPTILIALILIGISLLVGIAMLTALLIIGIPMIFLTGLAFAVAGLIGALFPALLGILLLFAISISIRTLLTVFDYTVWTLVFKQLKKD